MSGKIVGLTSSEVKDRIEDGKVNYDETPKTKTIKEIIKDNFFNYFNFLNIVLGGVIILASIFSGNFLKGVKNCLFMGVIIVNSIISIIEEIISKKITDKLSVIGEKKAIVIRDGKEKIINVDEIVLDDIVLLKLGHQIAADTLIISGSLEVNESLITGESDAIKKSENDTLLSGSFIVSGEAYGKVIHVGKDNYAAKISSEAKYKKDANSIVMGSFTKVLKLLSLLIIPIGILMFLKEVSITDNYPESVFTTVASLIGMIPEGLILLSSSVMAVGIVKLYKSHVLVQKLYSIETLARVDTICLDKTGTLTTGNMKYVDLIAKNYEEGLNLLRRYTLASKDTNATMEALKKHFKGSRESFISSIPFSSDRKYSCIEFNDYVLYLGAPDILINKELPKEIKEKQDDFRVLAFLKGSKVTDNFKDLELIGFILIEDIIRKSCKDTLDYFKANNVNVKIISGDNIKTVINIAHKVGLNDIKGININDKSLDELKDIVDKYDCFGRVSPKQKKVLINALQKKGHTVAMTGDGVNDVLALKASDCAISVKSGTDAARNVSELILLDDDFNSLPKVVEEGRQIINNIERSASLLLMKTLYTIMLIIFSVLSLQKYFFIPIQLTFITTFTIGAPSFFLALEPNKSLVKGKFLIRIFARALPTALTVLVSIILTSIFSSLLNLSYDMQSSISVILTTIVGLMYLFKICSPLNPYRATVFFTMFIGFIICLLFYNEFFNIKDISKTSALIIFVLTLDAIYIYKIINYFITFIFNKFDKTIKVVK